MKEEAQRFVQDHRYGSALKTLSAHEGRLHYRPKAWVPDEYEDLERLGLVRCEHGFADTGYVGRERLRSRTIHITDAGRDIVGGAGGEVVPLHWIRGSFAGALERRGP